MTSDPEKVAQEAGVEQAPRVAVVGNVEFNDPNLDKSAILSGILEDDSPYPEVRSAVANTDDPDIPASTLRSWALGLIWAIILPGLNQFFTFRLPSVSIGGVIAQLFLFPMGVLWARIVPNITICGMQLNPGPFTIKEHVLSTIMATVCARPAYAMDVIAVQRVYYNQIFNFSYQWFIVMSTQLIGFSIGGIARRFLVQPPSMIWPSNLVTCSLFNTLHGRTYAGVESRDGISRQRLFVYAFVGSATWFFVPGYLFQGLSYFAWVCWIAPDNVPLNQMFGYVNGLGMSIITFDWTQIAFLGSPLVTPWWAEAIILSSFITFFFQERVVRKFPAHEFPRLVRQYWRSICHQKHPQRDSTFNQQKYDAYSPLFISTTFAVSYGLAFASATATVTHAFLFFRKQIWAQARRSMKEQPDVHARLMAVYPQVPDWWYAIIFVVMFVFGIVSIEVWKIAFPVQFFILALVISFGYVVPAGMIQAITNQPIALNVITELIIGYALPGHPVAMMLFKTWGYITMTQALMFTSDFKLGHYMKIPPKSMFWAQIVATIIAGTVQLGVQAWMFSNIEDMCSPRQKQRFVCASAQVFATASYIWGVIGPARQFSKGQLYYSLLVFFPIGFVCPVISYAVERRWPNNKVTRYLNFPLVFTGAGAVPPATGGNYIPWAAVGFVFQYVIRRKHFAWWTKYNYVLSAGLDMGVAISAVLIFFILQYPKGGKIGVGVQNWWGNAFPFTGTADALGTPIMQPPPGQKFGPLTWH